MSKLSVEKKAFIPYLVGLKQNFIPGERWEYSDRVYHAGVYTRGCDGDEV